MPKIKIKLLVIWGSGYKVNGVGSYFGGESDLYGKCSWLIDFMRR